MHHSSFQSMKKFVNEYLENSGGSVLDVGSMDINGSYRELFGPAWQYTGLDILPGPNVDFVPADRYYWSEIENNEFDVVISGQALEHIEEDKKIVQEMNRILDYDGLCCIIVPSAGPKHGYPNDYRRYSIESLKELMESTGFKMINIWRNNAVVWFDIVGIGQK